MPLVDMRDMLNHAYRNHYAVGGFNVVSLEFLEAILAAAENCHAPVILSLAEPHVDHYDFELAMAATEKAARRATVPVSIHLDHGSSLGSAVRAINLGCNSVMVDASHESFSANVAYTRRVVEMAHACGATVEGELGYVTGVEGEDSATYPVEAIYALAEDAEAFVQGTDVDCLAVSIGTEYERLKRINNAVKIPLVIHGGTGLTEEQYRRLISHGVARINCYAALADAAGNSIRASARADTRCGYSGLMKDVRESICREVERYLRLWDSAGRAAEVLAQCQAWRPVEHVIIYNVEHVPDSQVEAMMARGREVLAKIPGVRRVVTGWAVTEKPKYRFCWLIEFAHQKVIESYRDHPEHVAFANSLFRPIAGDRVSIDFVSISEAAPAPCCA